MCELQPVGVYALCFSPFDCFGLDHSVLTSRYLLQCCSLEALPLQTILRFSLEALMIELDCWYGSQWDLMRTGAMALTLLLVLHLASPTRDSVSEWWVGGGAGRDGTGSMWLALLFLGDLACCRTHPACLFSHAHKVSRNGDGMKESFVFGVWLTQELWRHRGQREEWIGHKWKGLIPFWCTTWGWECRGWN